MHRVRTAVVGVGALGKHHLKWLAKLENSQLVGCFDLDRARAEQHANEHGVQVFDSLADCAAHADAISIVVPTRAHYACAEYLLNQGKHILIEKPVTSTVAEAESLAALARTKQVKVGVGHIERYNPAVRAALEMGIRPAFIEGHRLASFDPRGTDVAVIHDLMIHDIDLALLLIGSPVVDVQASSVAVLSTTADICNARLTFASGAVANLTASRISLKEMRKLRLFQSSGYVSLDLARREADMYQLVDGGTPVEGMRLPFGKSGREIVYRKRQDDGVDMLGAELSAFLDAIRFDRPVPIPLDQATEALRVAELIEQGGTRSGVALSGAIPR